MTHIQNGDLFSNSINRTFRDCVREERRRYNVTSNTLGIVEKIGSNNYVKDINQQLRRNESSSSQVRSFEGKIEEFPFAVRNKIGGW